MRVAGVDSCLSVSQSFVCLHFRKCRSLHRATLFRRSPDISESLAAILHRACGGIRLTPSSKDAWYSTVRVKCPRNKNQAKGKIMAGKDKDSIYKVVEVVGTSKKSWADAGRRAVEAAGGSLRDLRIAEVVKLDMAIENGKVRTYRARVALSFKYEG
jgi:hypothetical protein